MGHKVTWARFIAEFPQNGYNLAEADILRSKGLSAMVGQCRGYPKLYQGRCPVIAHIRDGSQTLTRWDGNGNETTEYYEPRDRRR